MFEDSLVESSGRLRRRNPWATAASFAIQIAVAGFVVLLSLLYTDALPIHSLISTVEAPSPMQVTPAVHAVKLARAQDEFDRGVLIVPQQIPKSIATIHDEQRVGESNPLPSIGVFGAVPFTLANNPHADVLRIAPNPMPRATLSKVRVSSGVVQALLVHQVRPQYPQLALQARIQGMVVLQAMITKDGTVQDLRVVSGHPLLTEAAIVAVKQWRYRPYHLNNEPVAVDTEINVNFTLSSE
jgi:periplasmic protein TonB